jgi:hypothetical protein
MKNLKINLLLVSFACGLIACSFVSLTPEAKNIAVTTPSNALKNCKFLGNTNVSLWSKAETFQSQKTVESQLDTLARNQAATMGGNTVVASSAIDNGQRAYAVYNCPAH